MQEVPPGPPDQVTRLERYRQEHPDVDIQPPGAQSAVWRAFRDGELIAYGFTLMVFMERLEGLPELLGAVQDFGLHSLARHARSGCRKSRRPRNGQRTLGLCCRSTQQHVPLWWTDGVGQAVPSYLRLRRT